MLLFAPLEFTIRFTPRWSYFKVHYPPGGSKGQGILGFLDLIEGTYVDWI